MDQTYWFKKLGFIEEKNSQGEVTDKIAKDIQHAINLVFSPFSSSLNPNAFIPFSLSTAYVAEIRSGTLTITLSPDKAVALPGAQWRRTGTDTWYDSGATEYHVPPGIYQIEYKEVPNFITPQPEIVIVNVREPIIAEEVYVYDPPYGDLKITLGPQEAIDAGARWRIKGTEDWHVSGYTATWLREGNYEIEFATLEWTNKPADAIVTVVKQSVHEYAYAYEILPKWGYLKVTLGPSEAITEGAKWRRVGTVPWLDSGYTEPNVLVGDYEVEFFYLPAWFPIGRSSVTITGNNTTELTQTYVLIPTKGMLKVLLEPEEIHTTLGGKWRRQGTTPWFLHGDVENDILQGSYEIEFPTIYEWDSPPTTNVTIIPEVLSTVTGTYTYHPIHGDLEVIIDQPELIALGAKWKLSSETEWRDSGARINSLLIGDYTIEFNIIPEWAKPDNVILTLQPAVLNSITRSYTWAPTIGDLQVVIQPTKAIDGGCKWRRVGTADWRDSGYKEVGILGGTYDVEFLTPDANVYIAPEIVETTIIPGQRTDLEATFVLIGSPGITVEELKVLRPQVVSGKKRIPPKTVTVTILNGEATIKPTSVTVPYMATATFDVEGIFIIKANDENIVTGGTLK